MGQTVERARRWEGHASRTGEPAPRSLNGPAFAIRGALIGLAVVAFCAAGWAVFLLFLGWVFL